MESPPKRKGKVNHKIHSHEAGYIAERLNPFIPGEKVVIYRANEQGIDVGIFKYAVVCDAHDTVVGESSIPKARMSMKRPDNFCDECRRFEGEDA